MAFQNSTLLLQEPLKNTHLPLENSLEYPACNWCFFRLFSSRSQVWAGDANSFSKLFSFLEPKMTVSTFPNTHAGSMLIPNSYKPWLEPLVCAFPTTPFHQSIKVCSIAANYGAELRESVILFKPHKGHWNAWSEDNGGLSQTHGSLPMSTADTNERVRTCGVKQVGLAAILPHLTTLHISVLWVRSQSGSWVSMKEKAECESTAQSLSFFASHNAPSRQRDSNSHDTASHLMILVHRSGGRIIEKVSKHIYNSFAHNF